MSNCIIAQSGGPSPVIKSAVAGIVKANRLSPLYEKVYGGLHGLEGILQEQFVDLTDMSEEENRLLKSRVLPIQRRYLCTVHAYGSL